MPLLDVLPDTDPAMRKNSRRVRRVDDNLRNLVADMYDTMVANWGIGLAAVQVGLQKRLFIYEIPQREVKGYETCRPDRSLEEKEQSEAAKPAEDDAESDEDDEEDESEPDPGYTGDYTVCINPRIISREGSRIDDEGCLSKAGWMAKVERAYQITFQARDLDMVVFERTVTGLEARCVQHEIDHMDGILFTDRAQPGTLREITEDEEEGEEATGESASAEEAASREQEDVVLGRE